MTMLFRPSLRLRVCGAPTSAITSRLLRASIRTGWNGRANGLGRRASPCAGLQGRGPHHGRAPPLDQGPGQGWEMTILMRPGLVRCPGGRRPASRASWSVSEQPRTGQVGRCDRGPPRGKPEVPGPLGLSLSRHPTVLRRTGVQEPLCASHQPPGPDRLAPTRRKLHPSIAKYDVRS